MKLTKQLIKRFESPTIYVRVMNGYFKTASATVEYANGWKYVVEVEHTPELLKPYGDFNDHKFLYPDSKNSWVCHKIPEELKFVEHMLEEKVHFSDDEVYTLRLSIDRKLAYAMEQLGM